MLGLGFLARQLGNLGGAIKGGFQGMQRMGQARQQGGGMDQFRTPGINPNAEGGGGLPLSGIAAKVANKLGIGGGGIGLKTDTDILPGINAGVDLPFTGPNRGRPQFSVDANVEVNPDTRISGRETFGFQRPGAPDRVSTSTTAGDIPVSIPQRLIAPIHNPTPDRAPQMTVRNGRQEFYERKPEGGNLRQMMDTSVNLHDQMRGQLSPMAGANPAMIAAPETRPPELPGARVQDVRIPSIPGIPGGSQPYDPIAKERFDYVYRRMPKRQVEHTADDGSKYAVQEERPYTRGERFKAALLPMVAGAALGARNAPGNPLWGAIGGAGTGFATGAINPNAGSQIAFNTFTEPRLLADQARREDDYRRGVQREREGLGVEKDRADIDYRRAQADATRAGMKDADLERQYRRSQIDSNNALAEARRTGKPQIRNVVDSDGVSRTYSVYPDERLVYLGDSEKAALATEANQSRERIATGRNQTAVQTTEMRQAGATGRTAMTQAGQDRRAAQRQTGDTGAKSSAGATGGKRKSFVDRAVSAGYSRAEAEAEANRRGLK